MIRISKQLIRNLNLTPAQTEVYVAALELGQASMQDLSRKSGVKRTTIYKFIDELIDRNFIVETKYKKRSVYSAVSPDQLVVLVKNQLEELTIMLPQLKAIENRAAHKPKVMYYEGVEAIKGMYADTLKDRMPIVGWSDLKYTKSALGKFIEEYPDERARRNITLRWIIPDSSEAREFTRRDYGLLRDTKFLPKANFKIDVNIYGDKISLVNASASTPFAVLIQNQDVAETMREVWQQLWDRLP